jgi:HJR/Mrr/RecB family endonuclease
MEILRDIILFLHIYRFEILLVILLSFLGFLYWAFPKIEKKIIEKNKLLDEKDETLSGARIHYKDLLIEVKTLKIENEALKQRISELEEYEKKIKKITFEENRKERFKNHLKTASNKGKEFEEFVAGHFKLDGYEIRLNGIKEGKKDKGIDIICTKDEELILIQ